MLARAARRLTILAILAIATGLTAYTAAWFGATSSSRANEAGTGSVRLALGEDAATAVAGEGLRPRGSTETRTRLVNTGTVPARLFARIRPAAASDLLDALLLDLAECVPAGVDAPGASADCSTAKPRLAPTVPGDAGQIELGIMAPGAVRVFRTRLTWPVENDSSALYGERASVTLHWSLRTDPPAKAGG